MRSRGEVDAELEVCLALLRAGVASAMDRLSSAVRPILEVMIQQRAAARVLRWDPLCDLVQRIEVEVVGELRRGPLPASADELRTHMGRIVKVRVQDARRNVAKLMGESAVPLGCEAVMAPAPSTGPITAADSRRWLEQLISSLPERYAVVVRLCALERLTYVEAAQRLGLSPDTVRKRYAAAGRELERRRRSGGSA